MCFRQIHIFLTAVSEADTGHSAGSDRDDTLLDLIRVVFVRLLLFFFFFFIIRVHRLEDIQSRNNVCEVLLEFFLLRTRHRQIEDTADDRDDRQKDRTSFEP